MFLDELKSMVESNEGYKLVMSYVDCCKDTSRKDNFNGLLVYMEKYQIHFSVLHMTGFIILSSAQMVVRL